MASGDVINSIEEYDLKDLGAKKKTSTIDRSSYGKILKTPFNTKRKHKRKLSWLFIYTSVYANSLIF